MDIQTELRVEINRQLKAYPVLTMDLLRSNGRLSELMLKEKALKNKIRGDIGREKDNLGKAMYPNETSRSAEEFKRMQEDGDYVSNDKELQLEEKHNSELKAGLDILRFEQRGCSDLANMK